MITTVLFLPSMDSNVFPQIVLSSKGLLTMATDVGFLPCMNFIVFY